MSNTNKIKISYNANGGTGAAAPSESTYNPARYPYTASKEIQGGTPTRLYYDFKGWGYTSAAKSPAYQNGGTYSNTFTAANMNDDLTLYAVWEHQYVSVTYDANGGTGAPPKYTGFKGYSMTISATVPTRNGYRFRGWATSRSAQAAEYSANQSGVYFVSDTTLYAVWESLTYTVQYNANGGDGAPDPQAKEYGVDITLSNVVPTLSDHVFLGWSKSNTAQEPQYEAGDTFSENANITLYAVWQETKATLTYDANGGDGAPDPETKFGVFPIAFTVSSVIPTKPSKVFAGWALTSGALTAQYHGGDTLTLSEDKTLYAVWASKTYTVTYDANGGTDAPSAQTKIEGQTLQLTSSTPTKAGYQCYGWATSPDAVEPDYFPGDEYTNDANVTLYAVWRLVYSVSYDANGGTGAPTPQAKMQGVPITLQSTVPTKTGGKFLCWKSSAGDTYQPGDTYAKDEPTTMTALWNNFHRGKVFVVENGAAVEKNMYVVQSGAAARHDTYISFH